MASPLLSPKSLFASRNIPALIATTVSVGAHGLFFMGAPLLSASNELPEEQESVPVVALSPEESLRLPNELLNKPEDPLASAPDPFGSGDPLITQEGDQLLPVPGLPSYDDLSALADSNFDGPLQTAPPVFGNPADFFPPLPSQETIFKTPSAPENNLQRELELELKLAQERKLKADLEAELEAERKRLAAEEAERQRLEELAEEAERQRLEELAEEAERQQLAAEEAERKRQEELLALCANGGEQTLTNAMDLSQCEDVGGDDLDDDSEGDGDEEGNGKPDEEKGDGTQEGDGDEEGDDTQEGDGDEEGKRLAIAYTRRDIELPDVGQVTEQEVNQLVADGKIDLEAMAEAEETIFKTKADGSGKVFSAAFPDPSYQCPSDADIAEFLVVVPSDTDPVKLILTKTTGYDPLDEAAEAEANNQLQTLGWETGIYTLAIEFIHDAKNCRSIES